QAAAARARPEGQGASRPAPRAAAAEQDKPRFGINSLINRMTGSGYEAPAAAARRQPPVQSRQTAPVVDHDDEPEDDRIEIPAFLRRQAN
ncbi:cell division protein FtsZ, partial [Litorisediminicola beolgyonensis]